MPASPRLALESLDARDLPTVTPFSLALSDGTLISGSFDYSDAAVNPALASQQVPVSNLTVALNGQSAALPGQLNAATAMFAQGQFEGVSLTAVAGGLATLIDTTGAFAPISVSVPPVNTFPPVVGGGVEIDWAAAVEDYNAKLSRLLDYTAGPNIIDGRSGILQTEMDRDTYWKHRRDDAVALASGEPNPVWRSVYLAYLEYTLVQIRGIEFELSQTYSVSVHGANALVFKGFMSR